ncbi:MAG: hypothetical protein AAGL23_11800 [Pseudomonadota bacterium]
MFNSSFNTPILSTLAAAIVVASLSAPAMAGGGGGRDPEPAKFSSASSTDENGITTTVRGQNGANTRTVTTSRNGRILGIKWIKKSRTPFVSMTDENGNVSIVAGKPKRSSIPFVTLHNADGTTTTIAGKPLGADR